MSLQARILKAVNIARISLGDVIVSVVVTRVTNSGYDPTTLQPTQVTKVFTVQGFTALWDEDELHGDNVRFDDQKFYVFPTETLVFPGDTVKVGDVTYNVIRAAPVMAGNRTALIAIHLRK